MRTITLEEHYTTPGFLAGPGREYAERLRRNGGSRILEQLAHVGEGRIAEMDAAGIEMQVLSINTPGVEQSDAEEAVALAREANEFVAGAVRRHPRRFAG